MGRHTSSLAPPSPFCIIHLMSSDSCRCQSSVLTETSVTRSGPWQQLCVSPCRPEQTWLSQRQQIVNKQKNLLCPILPSTSRLRPLTSRQVTTGSDLRFNPPVVILPSPGQKRTCFTFDIFHRSHVYYTYRVMCACVS